MPEGYPDQDSSLKVSLLALPCSQIDEYIKYHHRTFIQQLMEAEVETHSRAHGWAPKAQLKSERSETMIKEAKTMMGHPLIQFICVNGSSLTPVSIF